MGRVNRTPGAAASAAAPASSDQPTPTTRLATTSINTDLAEIALPIR